MGASFCRSIPEFLEAFSRHVRHMPRCAKIGIAVASIATIVLADNDLVSFMFIVVSLAMCIATLLGGRTGKSFATKPATAEPFYHSAPHTMLADESVIGGMDADQPRHDVQWMVDDEDVVQGSEELMRLTPPELLLAAQTNEVPATS